MKYIVLLAVIGALIFAGWQFLAPEFSNYLFQDDLHDLSAQVSTHIGLAQPNSDEDLRRIIIKKAASHDIALQSRQITIRRNGYGDNATFYLAADYSVDVNLPGYSTKLHFTPSSASGK